VIFLTIGSHEPFDRLVRAVDEWAAARPGVDIFAQITDRAADGYVPKHFPWVGKMTPGDYQAKVDAADFLVAHAGMGSIITALRTGKPIVVLPRRGDLGETRNDHQLATAAKLAAKPGIFVAHGEAELPAQMDAVRARIGQIDTALVSPFAEQRLIEALRESIFAR
jgi:UDP-N-acetylglucosamine transferase subunit ALG13